jgi:hypothetical protein
MQQRCRGTTILRMLGAAAWLVVPTDAAPAEPPRNYGAVHSVEPSTSLYGPYRPRPWYLAPYRYYSYYSPWYALPSRYYGYYRPWYTYAPAHDFYADPPIYQPEWLPPSPNPQEEYYYW